MKRRITMHVETLEGKTLLSGLSLNPTPSQPRPVIQPIPTPRSEPLSWGLSSSLTTSSSVYQAGQPIPFTFTATNMSQHPINLQDGPSIDGFRVTQNGQAVWVSNAGINPMFIRLVTLQPGQSFTLMATWNGIPSAGASTASVETGTFVVSNELDPTAKAAFQITPSSLKPIPPVPDHPSAPSSPSTPDPSAPSSPSTPDPSSPSPVSPQDPAPVVGTPAGNPSGSKQGHVVHVTHHRREKLTHLSQAMKRSHLSPPGTRSVSPDGKFALRVETGLHWRRATRN